jgi:hypothetical protein
MPDHRDDFPRLAPRKVVLATVTATNRDAKDSIAGLRRCGVHGYIKRMQ